MGLFIIFILLLVFVFVPLGKIAYRVWQAQRRWQQAAQGMRDTFNRAAGQQKPEQPPVKKKKIDPSVGEYVAFEDIACDVKTSTTYTDSQGNTGTVYTESRVEDAVWEDIKIDKK